MTSKSTAIATPQNLRVSLDKHRDQLQEYLGKDVDVDHYIGGILEEFERNHALYTCTPASVLQSVRKAALAGLPLGQEMCYLVPYAERCQFQMGYRGLLYLARDSGAVLRHVVRSVHEGDRFIFDDGLTPNVVHERVNLDPTWDNLTHVYAHFALPMRQEHLEVLTKSEVEKHKKQYVKAAGKDSPWQTNPLAMAKKTVIRRAFAGDQLPISSRLRQIVLSDEFNEIVDGSVVQPTDGPDGAVMDTIEETGMDAAHQPKPSPGQRELALGGDLDVK